MSGEEKEVLAGEAIRTSILIYKYHADVLRRIGEVWSDVGDNQSKAVRKAIEQVAYQLEGPGRTKLARATFDIVARMATEAGVSIVDIVDGINGNGDTDLTSIEVARVNGCDCVGEYDEDGMEVSR